MKIKHEVQDAMDTMGIIKLRKQQIKPINSILSCEDTLMIAPTSSGKSAVFHIPANVRWKKEQQWTLVIEPTVSLMEVLVR